MRKSFCPTLTYQIKDEKKASKEYLTLAKKLKKGDAKVVRGIARDERRHKRVLTKIRRKNCEVF